MNDRRWPEQTGRQEAEPTLQFHRPDPPYADPAYAGQSPYTRPQGPFTAPSPTGTNPTAKLPRSGLRDQAAPDQQAQQPPPDPPKTPRWLWIAAAAAVALAIVMVITLVIANGSAKNETVVAPMPTSKSPASSTSNRPSPTATSTPSATATSPPESSAATRADAVDTVVYSVTGEGRAISITYRDNGDVMATEFNVALPWSKEVSLPKSGKNANLTIVNIGHDVTCTLTVASEQVRRHTGVGLTICDAPA